MIRARVNLQKVIRTGGDSVAVNGAVQYHESRRADNHFIRRVAEPIVKGIHGYRAADIHFLAGAGIEIADSERLDVGKLHGIAERVVESAMQVKVFRAARYTALVMPDGIRLIRAVAIG